MPDNGKIVRCLSVVSDVKGPHDVNRAVCFFKPLPECRICPHSAFTIKFQLGIGNQEVACPRWIRDKDRLLGNPPINYVPIRREVCLTSQPFPWCPSCPNSDPSNLPHDLPGWYEERIVEIKPGKFEEDD